MTNINETEVPGMSDTPNIPKAQEAPNDNLSSYHQTGRKVIWVALMINILCLLALGYVYNNNLMISKNIAELNGRFQQVSLLKTEVATYQSKVEPVVKQFEEAEKNKSANVQTQLQLKTLLVNLKTLVNLAIIKLNVDHDTVNTLLILNTVQETIKSQNLLDLTNLRKLVMLKIEQLNQVNQPDVDHLQALLQEYSNLVEHLSLKDFLITNQTKIAIDRTSYSQDFTTKIQESSYWKKVWTDIQNNLRSLITIRNIKDSENSFKRLLTEEQINMLKTYLKLKGTELSLNLLERNQKLYVNNLIDIEHNIQLYFVNDSGAKPKLLNILSKLKAADLSMPFVDLQEISTEINNLSNFATI